MVKTIFALILNIRIYIYQTNFQSPVNSTLQYYRVPVNCTINSTVNFTCSSKLSSKF